MLDEIKALLSPAGAWLWAELGNPAFYYLSGWVGVLDEIKAILSPAGAWLWA